MNCGRTFWWLHVFVVVCALSLAARGADHAPAKAGDLSDQNHIWNVYLTFGADQWNAMEPAPGGKGWGALFSNQPKPAEAASVAAMILKRADRNHDGALDRKEFRSLAKVWFDRWDRDGAGVLDNGRLEAGLDAALDPEGAGQPGAFAFPLRGAPGKRNGLASLFGVEFKQVHARLDFEDTSFMDVGVRYKGNGTFVGARNLPKRSLKIDLNDYTAGQKIAGLGKLNLHNRVGDPNVMTESLAYRLYREAGVAAPRTTYAKVFITAPPKYHRTCLGLYSIVEDVDDTFARDRFSSKGGAIFKPAILSLFADLGDHWSDYAQAYDAKTRLSGGQMRRVIEFSRLVTYAGDAEFADRVGDYLDLDQFARYMAVTVYLANIDSILHTGQNYYLYLDPKTNKFRLIPWDMDGSFGQIFGQQEHLAKLSVRKPWVGPNRFLERVFKVDAFKKAYLARLDEFSRTIFAPERFHAQVDQAAAAIRSAIAEESKEKVIEFDRAVANAPVRSSPGVFALGSLFASKPPNSIKRFVDARTPSVIEQLAGKNQGEPASGFTGFGNQRSGSAGKTLAPAFLSAMDRNKDHKVTRDEFRRGLDHWFDSWGGKSGGPLALAQLQAGIAKDVSPPAAPPPSFFPTSRPATQGSRSGKGSASRPTKF